MTDWLTDREARDHLRVSKSTMCRLRREGLPHYWLLGTLRYDRSEIDGWLRKHRQAQPLRRHLRRVS